MWPTATFYSWVGKRRRKLHDSVDVVDSTADGKKAGIAKFHDLSRRFVTGF